MSNQEYPLAFDRRAALQLAQELRECSHPPTEKAFFCGSFNCVLILEFEDGVKWVFRTPRRDVAGPRLPTELAADLVASEAATLRFLRKHSNIPVPLVHDYSCSSSNPIGVPYIVMDCAAGVPLASLINPLEDPSSGLQLSNEHRKKVYEQLGMISSQLYSLKFPKIGSLFEEDGLFHVRHSLAPVFYFQDRCLLPEIDRGPFAGEKDYYHSLLGASKYHVQHLGMGYHCLRAPVPAREEFDDLESYRYATDVWNDFVAVGDKLESSQNRLDYFIASSILEEIVPEITVPNSALSSGSGFPLSHPDLSPNNIFVDDDYNITSIIDWEFSSTVPVSQLLATPGLPHPRNLRRPSDKTAFKAGFDNASRTSTLSVAVDPLFWAMTDPVWHFVRWANMDSLCDYDHFEHLCGLLESPKKGSEPLDLIQSMRQDERFKVVAMELLADDLSVKEIERAETDYFSALGNGISRYETARWLTTQQQDGIFISGAKPWLLPPHAQVERKHESLDLMNRHATKGRQSIAGSRGT